MPLIRKTPPQMAANSRVISSRSRWDPWSSASKDSGAGGGGGGGGEVAGFGRVEESRSISRWSIGLIAGQLFLTFLAICCIGSLAAFQRTWNIGVSGLNGFLLFLLLLTFFLSLALLLPPLIWDRYGKLQLAKEFLDQPRNKGILMAAGMVAVVIGTIALTVSAFTQPGCKDPTRDPHAGADGIDEEKFEHGLGRFCTTKKAAAIFLWLNFACWLGNLLLHLITHQLMPWQSDRLSGALSTYASHRRGGASADEGQTLEKIYSSDLYPSRWDPTMGGGGGGGPMSSKDVEKRRAATQEERDIGEEHVDGYNVPMPYVPMAQYRAPPFSDIDETTEPPSRSSTVATGYRAISTSIPKVKETFGKMLPLWNKSRLASSSVGGGGEAPGISRTMLLAARDDPVEDPFRAHARISSPPPTNVNAGGYRYSPALRSGLAESSGVGIVSETRVEDFARFE